MQGFIFWQFILPFFQTLPFFIRHFLGKLGIPGDRVIAGFLFFKFYFLHQLDFISNATLNTTELILKR